MPVTPQQITVLPAKDASEYNVGWICAISTEYVAAQAFLDERHDRPEAVHVHDNNDYTLGRIGRHQVVIAVLPEGEYGLCSAATVAEGMLHSFPNVRLGLMVGIGGGAPSPRHDIRLGDVVVSTPCDGHGGVFQYDFGKTILGQPFRPTGVLSLPPMILRAAVSGLKSDYEIKGHNFNVAINSILEKNPRLLAKYKRPDPGSDRLYKSHIIHPLDDEGKCEVVCGDDESKCIARRERTEYEDNPAIHYGQIASANQLMKDASIRDKLAAEKGVLCFEMEAAGLMNHFPCLVIRGICDYSDSHKNKEWQGYAAMVAAAYAKDLLHRIPPNKVEAEKKISQLLSNVSTTMSRTEEKVDTITAGLAEIKDRQIIDWLSDIDYGAQQSDHFRRRQQGTGQWFLNSPEFQGWLKTSQATLFCRGIPGAGKTILSSVVINYLAENIWAKRDIGLAYVYLNFREKETVESLLSSVLKQLAERQSAPPKEMEDLFKKHQAGRTRPSLEEISRTLNLVANRFSRVFIVIDALDECQPACREKFLLEIFSLQKNCVGNIIATSRFVPEITEMFQGSMSIEIRASNDDVRKYLDSHISQLPSFVGRCPDLQEEIKSTIVRVVDGMFLLAQLHLDSLVGKRSPKSIRAALHKLPTGTDAYDHAYKAAMERIEGQRKDQKDLAKQVLFWITCTMRPLTALELQHALAVEVGEQKLDEDNFSEIGDMISVCAGLVTTNEENGVIRFVHYTTQEFFERTQDCWFPCAEIEITKICLTYLSFSVFGAGFCRSNREFKNRLKMNKLFDYTARNWGHHSRRASIKGVRSDVIPINTTIEPSGTQENPTLEPAAYTKEYLTLREMILRFLVHEAYVAASSQALLVAEAVSWIRIEPQGVPDDITGVHLVAYFGLSDALDVLIKTRRKANSKNSYAWSPLIYAAADGPESITNLLSATEKLEFDFRGSTDGRTPLSWAAEKGHETVVGLLLETEKVDPDSKDLDGQTPLSWAVGNGHETVVRLLLETGKVDPDSKDLDGHTPLSWAAENGHETVVRLLLETGKVDPDSKDLYGRTPLFWAAENGRETVVRMLLDTGKVDPDSKDTNGRTPLSWAAKNGHETVVRLLLETNNL